MFRPENAGPDQKVSREDAGPLGQCWGCVLEEAAVDSEMTKVVQDFLF